MRDRLKPCPFCRGEAHFITTSNNSNHNGVGFGYIIACSICKCTPIQKAKELVVFLNQTGEVQITDASKVVMEHMIDEWNRRATE